MRQWQLGNEPGWKNFRCETVPDPVPQGRQVLVRMRAASLNYRDTIVATSKDRFSPGLVPLSDGAGEVVGVGPEVKEWKVGDHVIGTFFQHWQSGRFDMKYHQAAMGGAVDGVLQELMTFPEESLVQAPQSYSFEESSTLPCAGLTAWSSLMDRGRFVPGDTVLVLGTGGVSIWALQIAVAAGGKVIVTSSSDQKLEKAKELGAWETINYQSNSDWEKTVYELTGGQGVDHVVEVGGPGTLGKSLASVAAGGSIALIGVLTGFSPPDASLFPLLSKNVNLNGIYVGNRESLKQFVRFLDTTNIKPVIDTVFRFEDAIEAYDKMKSGQHLGKLVIAIN